MREDVNPDMVLSKGTAGVISKPKKVGASGGASTDVNSPMDLTKKASAQPGTPSKIAASGPYRADVNPDMNLSKGSDSGEATQKEKDAAKVPGEGTMPTGMKAADKATPGMG